MTLISDSLTDDFVHDADPDVTVSGDTVVFIYYGQVYRYQVSLGALLNVSTQSPIVALGGDTTTAFQVRISDDGRYVAYSASSRFSVYSRGTANSYNVYVYDTQTSTAEIASVDASVGNGTVGVASLFIPWPLFHIDMIRKG